MANNNSHKRSILMLYGAILLLAINGLFSKVIPLDAVSQTSLRSLFATLTILTTLIVMRRRIFLVSGKDYWGVYGLGILMGFHWVTFFHAMQVSTVAVGMLALFSFPVLTVLIEPFFSQSKLHRGDIVAAFLLFLGLVIMASPKLLEPQSNLLQGIGWGVLSAFIFVFRNLLQKYYFSHVSSDRLMLHQLIAIFIMLVLFLDIQGAFSMSTMSWMTVIFMGIFTTAFAHTILVASYKRLTAKTVAMISSLQTPIAAVLAWWFLGEELTWNVVIGGGVILSVALHQSFQKYFHSIMGND